MSGSQKPYLHLTQYQNYDSSIGRLIEIQPNKECWTKGWQEKSESAPYIEGHLYGVVPHENILIIDVDVKAGKKGLESWVRLKHDLYGDDWRDYYTPNVVTPSGGYHYYITIPDDVYQDINKHHPDYPDIDFITHNKAYVVCGNQNLDQVPKEHEYQNNYHLLGGFFVIPAPKHLSILLVKKKEPKPTIPQPLPLATEYTAHQISQLLTYISSDNYNSWIRVAWALMSTNLTSDEQFTLFDTWSQKSDKYDPNKTKSKWDSLSDAYNPTLHTPITIWSLVWLAKQENPSKHAEINTLLQLEDVGDLIGRFCDVQNRSGQPFFDLKTRQYYKEPAVMAMLDPLVRQFKEDKGIKINKNNLRASGIIHTVIDALFMPTKPVPLYFDDKGAMFVNTFDPSDFPPAINTINITSQATKVIDFYINHLRQLVSDKYTQPMLDFFKFIRQQPGHKVRWMPVLEGGYGTGKGLLLEVIKHHVIGHRHYRTINTRDFLSENNSWAVGSLLVQIEELLVTGKNAKEAMNVIKTLITNPVISRTEKYVTTAQVENFTSYIALSNEITCLKHADPRRYFAVTSPVRSPDDLDLGDFTSAQDYFTYLAYLGSPKNNEGGIFQQYFMTSPISDSFSPDVVPPSDFHLFRDEAQKTEEYSDLIELICYVAGTKTLPTFISSKEIIDICDKETPLGRRHQENQGVNPEIPPAVIRDPQINLSFMKKFGKKNNYKSFSGWLYSNTINDDKAQDIIRHFRAERHNTRSANQNQNDLIVVG